LDRVIDCAGSAAIAFLETRTSSVHWHDE